MKWVLGEEVVVPIIAVAVAMVVGMLMIAVTGHDPFLAYSALIQGALGSPVAVANTLNKATPLILTGLAVALAFRAGLFNIGGTGQLVMGMILGGWCALHFAGLPAFFHLPLVLLFSAIGGGLWAGLAGYLKAVRGAHEVITTIMFNYIAIRLGELLLSEGGKLAEKGTTPQSAEFTQSSGLPIVWQADPFTVVHGGLIVALLAAAAVWFILAKTTLGYEIRSVGLNAEAAEYGGIGVARTVIVAMVIAGAMAGLAGASIAVGDTPIRLTKSEFSAIGAGFTGIAVALLGRNTVPGVIAAALLFGGLDAGATQVQFSGGLESGVATKLIQVIQGLIIFFVGADALFRKYVTRYMAIPGKKASA
jgi:simple sugar transport system permease protein